MKIISFYSSIIKAFSIMILMGMVFMVQSCKKEPIGEKPVNVGTVRFAANAYTIENKATDPLVVTIPLSLPLEQDATVLVSIDTSSTIKPDQYVITPAIPVNGLLINLPKGSTEVSLNVKSLNNFEGIKTLVLILTMPSGGVTVANTNARAVINIKGDPIIYPEIKTSVSTLTFANTVSGLNSASMSYSLTGVKLIADVQVAASENFEVSLDNVNFASNLTIPIAAVKAGATTLYARFTALTGVNQTVSGTITHSSGTVPENVIAVSGIEYGVASPGVLLMKEDFNYGSTAGTLDDVSGGNWKVFSGNLNPIAYLTNGLTFAGYAGSNIGGAIVSENGSGSRKDYETTNNTNVASSGVVYAAQLINVSATNTTVDFFAGMRQPGSGSYFNRINIKDDGTGKPTFGIGKSSSTVAYASGTYNLGTTYLVVTKYDFDTGISSMYILNSAPTKYEPPVANATTSAGSGPSSIAGIFVRQNAGVLTATFDGVRLATSWKDAVGL